MPPFRSTILISQTVAPRFCDEQVTATRSVARSGSTPNACGCHPPDPPANRHHPDSDAPPGGHEPLLFHLLAEAESASIRRQTLPAANIARVVASWDFAASSKCDRPLPRHCSIGINDYGCPEPLSA